jgi:formylglycine-generating enzyme required for sulfatase activity
MKKKAFFIIATLLVCFSLAVADNSWSEGADINGDGIVEYKDFAIMAKYWLASEPNIPDITWVDINDPGFVGEMSKYETTNAQYAQYLNAALASNDIRVEGSYVKGNRGSYAGHDYYQLDGTGNTYDGATNGGKSRITYIDDQFTVDAGFENHPVTYVSWYGAAAFASYYSWRLPTEWEWQSVASYNGAYAYGCGNTIDNNIANYVGSDHPDGTTEVGSFGTFGYGLADMAGNVWEWTSSFWDTQGGYPILRGGGWYDYDFYCSVSHLYFYYTYGMSFDLGFRVCR